MIGWPTICFYVEANIDWLQILTGILQFTYVQFPRGFLFDLSTQAHRADIVPHPRAKSYVYGLEKQAHISIITIYVLLTHYHLAPLCHLLN